MGAAEQMTAKAPVFLFVPAGSLSSDAAFPARPYAPHASIADYPKGWKASWEQAVNPAGQGAVRRQRSRN